MSRKLPTTHATSYLVARTMFPFAEVVHLRIVVATAKGIVVPAANFGTMSY